MFNEKSIDVHGISLLSFLDMVVFEQKEGGGNHYWLREESKTKYKPIKQY